MRNLYAILGAIYVAVISIPGWASPAIAAESTSSDMGMLAIGAGLTIAIAAVGGAYGQAKAAVAALEGIARNPAAQGKLFVPFILALALIESLVIYAFVIAFQLSGKM